jgi:hypothetical protein
MYFGGLSVCVYWIIFVLLETGSKSSLPKPKVRKGKMQVHQSGTWCVCGCLWFRLCGFEGDQFNWNGCSRSLGRGQPPDPCLIHLDPRIPSAPQLKSWFYLREWLWRLCPRFKK